MIACVSVNDAFVMAAWGEEHKATGKVYVHICYLQVDSVCMAPQKYCD